MLPALESLCLEGVVLNSTELKAASESLPNLTYLEVIACMAEDPSKSDPNRVSQVNYFSQDIPM